MATILAMLDKANKVSKTFSITFSLLNKDARQIDVFRMENSASMRATTPGQVI